MEPFELLPEVIQVTLDRFNSGTIEIGAPSSVAGYLVLDRVYRFTQVVDPAAQLAELLVGRLAIDGILHLYQSLLNRVLPSRETAENPPARHNDEQGNHYDKGRGPAQPGPRCLSCARNRRGGCRECLFANRVARLLVRDPQ